jgi:hypothetical protein
MEKEKMRGYRAVLISAVLAALLSTSAVAQDELKYFPEDVFMVFQLDLRAFSAMVPPDMLNEWKSKSMDEVGFDILGRVDSMTMGFPTSMMSGMTPDDFYGVLKGSFTIDEIKAGMQKAGKQVKTVQVGSLTAIGSMEAETEDSLIAAVGPGMFVIGSKSGIEKFQAVSGSSNNASANAMLQTAFGDANRTGFLRIAGYFDDSMKQMMSAQTPSMGSLNTFALVADYANEFLSFTTVLSADDASALEQMKMMMEQQLPMFTQMDSTGALAEVVDNLKMDISGTKMTITTGLSKATLEKLFEQFGGMMQMAMPQ